MMAMIQTEIDLGGLESKALGAMFLSAQLYV